MGYALLRRGQYFEAAAEFQTALTLDPNASDTHDELAVALGMSGNTPAAAYQFQKALRLDPASKTAQAHPAMAQKQMHR